MLSADRQLQGSYLSMEGRNGGRKHTGSSSCAVSSSSGTVSTTYTSTGSCLSSMSMEAALHVDFEVHDGENVWREETKEGRMKHMESLVQEFFGAPSANCCGDMRVLERWFSELGVGWVLHLPLSGDALPTAAAAGRLDHTLDARSWIRALAEIAETIRFSTSLFPDRSSLGLPTICEQGKAAVPADQFLLQRVTSKLLRRVRLFRTNSVGLPRGCEEQEPEVGHIPDQVQFAQFFQEAMLKMLAFVDFVVGTEVEEPYEKLSTLMGVRGALSKALPQIWLSSYSPPSALVLRIQHDIISTLAAKEGKMGETIWSTMQQVWTRIMEDGNGSLDIQTPQGSSDIHKATRDAVRYIGFLRANYSSVAPVVTGAARYGNYVPQNEDMAPFDSMIIEMVSCLEEKLGTISQSFPNHSLGFLFLINNLYYLMEQLTPNPMSCLNFSIAVLTSKIKSYIEYYLQVSWAPLLLCLHISHATPLWLRRYSSPLPKFDSEFLKIYEVQKLWKVPDPDLRGILRRAVTEKVISGLTEYSSDTDTVGTELGSTFTPQELKEMLQELFEG